MGRCLERGYRCILRAYMASLILLNGPFCLELVHMASQAFCRMEMVWPCEWWKYGPLVFMIECEWYASGMRVVCE